MYGGVLTQHKFVIYAVVLITKLRKEYCYTSEKIFKIGEYLAKLQTRT